MKQNADGRSRRIGIRNTQMIRRLSVLPSTLRLLILVPVLAGLVGSPGVPAAAASASSQWYLDRIGVPEAHRISQGEGVLIGMFTLRVDTELPGLRGRVRPHKRVDLLDRVTDPTLKVTLGNDIGRLGLIVAGGEAGILGVAPQAEVQTMQPDVLDPTKAAPALRWLVDNGASVIDASWALKRQPGGAVNDGIRYALANDVVVVTDAATIDGLSTTDTTGILVVGSVDQKNETAPPGRIDPRVDLVAPATYDMPGLTEEPSVAPSIKTLPELSAAALTAGAAALIRSAHPELNAASVIERLITTAEDLGAPGRDDIYGHGMLNVPAALTADVPAVTVNPLGEPGPPEERVWPLYKIVMWFGGIAAGVGALMTAGFGTALLRRSRRKPRTPAGPR